MVSTQKQIKNSLVDKHRFEPFQGQLMGSEFKDGSSLPPIIFFKCKKCGFKRIAYENDYTNLISENIGQLLDIMNFYNEFDYKSGCNSERFA
jgi:hypothetical protein